MCRIVPNSPLAKITRVDMTERRLTCMLCDISISNWLHNRAVGTLPMDRYEGPLISDANVDALSSVTPILLPFIWKSFSLIPQMLCVRAYVLLSLPGSLYVVHTIRNLHLSLSLFSPNSHFYRRSLLSAILIGYRKMKTRKSQTRERPAVQVGETKWTVINLPLVRCRISGGHGSYRICIPFFSDSDADEMKKNRSQEFQTCKLAVAKLRRQKLSRKCVNGAARIATIYISKKKPFAKCIDHRAMANEKVDSAATLASLPVYITITNPHFFFFKSLFTQKKNPSLSITILYRPHSYTFLLLIARRAYTICLYRILKMSTKALAFLAHDSESITRREEF